MEIVPKRKWQYPISIEREYARLLTAYVDKELEIVEEFLPDMVDSVYRNSVHNDAIGDWLGNLVDRVQKKVKEKLTPLAAIRKTFQQVNKFVSTQMTETVESLFGSKPRQFNNTRQFEMIQTIWTSQNLELVKSIDTQIMDKIRFMMSQRIIHAAEKPELKEQLIQEIQDLANVTRNRAALIAADQVGKLNSQLTQYRQVNAGIKEYIWNTRKDNRVRPAHASREGKKYKWSEPPSDGHPGWPIRCRCTALPVVDTDKTMLKPNASSYVSADFMSHNFRPSLASSEVIISNIPTRQVRNSQFHMNVESTLGEKVPVIRTSEMLLREVKEKLPKGYKFPQIVIVDMEKHFGLDPVGGYDRRTGKLFLASKYDTAEKIKEYVNRIPGQFANKTEYAPVLHELGHKYYYDLIKSIVKEREISYNVSKEIVDNTIKAWADNHVKSDRSMSKILSGYADDGYKGSNFTEIVAEAYSVSDSNKYAKELIALLEELM